MTHPWNLEALDGAAREERLGVLDDWAGWLVERYGLQRVIPRCWRRHPAMVEELNALELAWAAAYEGEEVDPEAPLRWHEDLAKTKERLAEWDRAGCAAGEHRTAGSSRVVGDTAATTRLDPDSRRRPRHDVSGADGPLSEATSGDQIPGPPTAGVPPC